MSEPAEARAGGSLAGCHECALVVRLPAGRAHVAVRCPRCGARVHQRKVNSLARTWALIITGAIHYLPANIYPVTIVTSLGKSQEDTIMSGVIYLLRHEMWPLALILFVASVAVPLLKLLILGALLISVQRRSSWRPRDRTRLYRITEIVGSWSMVDIYVVTILVALVHLGQLASIEAGIGATFFGGVVVATLLAAESFDPRLIWDRAEASHG